MDSLAGNTAWPIQKILPGKGEDVGFAFAWQDGKQYGIPGILRRRGDGIAASGTDFSRRQRWKASHIAGRLQDLEEAGLEQRVVCHEEPCYQEEVFLHQALSLADGPQQNVDAAQSVRRRPQEKVRQAQ